MIRFVHVMKHSVIELIENGRDEDACRQMDALADEDHTHHLTPQEYYHYKSNWWLTFKQDRFQYWCQWCTDLT